MEKQFFIDFVELRFFIFLRNFARYNLVMMKYPIGGLLVPIRNTKLPDVFVEEK